MRKQIYTIEHHWSNTTQYHRCLEIPSTTSGPFHGTYF